MPERLHSMCADRTPALLTRAIEIGFFAVLLACLAFGGCGDSCITGVVNPGGGIVTGTATTCPVGNQTGNVVLHVRSSLKPAAPSWPSDAEHIFVSLRGIEALPANPSSEDSPAWQELAPDLATHPVQVDLMARAADSCEPVPLSQAAVSAGIYSQIRLNMVPNQPQASESVPAENACEAIGFNCIVASNGSKRALASDDPSELRISAENIAGGSLRVLPDDHIRLAIEFEPRSSLIVPAGDASHLVPTFSLTQESACGSGQ